MRIRYFMPLALLLSLMLIACQQGEGSSQAKLAVVDMTRVMRDSEAGKAGVKHLESLQADMQAQLNDIQKRLEPLANDKRPLHAFAQEALAMAQLQHGKTAEARQAFVQLQLGQDVPDDIRQRAQAGVQAIDSGTAAGLAAIVRAAVALPAPAAAPAAAAAAAPAQAEAAPAAARP